MEHAATITKLSKKLCKAVLDDKEMRNSLFSGDFHSFELELKGLCTDLFNSAMQELLSCVSMEVCEQEKQRYEQTGMRKFEARNLSIELHTGHKVEVANLYAKSVDEQFSGNRHLLARYWSVIEGCSPLRLSQVGMCSALAPSYDIGNELLKSLVSAQGVSRVRKITQGLADWCSEREVDLALEEKEHLIGKRVVISIDGGRTRTKVYGDILTQGCADLRKQNYQTPWCEPKLFVIQVLDEKGELSRVNLPIYGVRFAEQDVLNLLRDYLVSLKIEQAASVQIVADGAQWIWNNLPALLVELGVPKQRIIETLDHAHAIKYVGDIIKEIPDTISEQEKNTLRTKFSTWLWQGKSLKIVRKCRALFDNPSKDVNAWINYLEKHVNRTQYAHLKKDKNLCGSGIVESGIRRIINLRFKNPSTFWYKDNVESLFFLRSLCLSKRWNIFIKNLVTFYYD